MREGKEEASKKLYFNPNLQIIFAVTLMSIMGVSSLTPAFPSIGREFNITPKEVAWLITLFTLPGVFLTPVLGIMADRFGRKTILVPSLILFGLAGGFSFFAESYELLCFLRFIQGCGGASLGALNITILGDIFHGRERSAAMGYNASMISVGTAAYPIVGGALATIGWNYPFLPPFLAIIVGFIVLFKLDNPEPKNSQTIKDYFSKMFKSVFDKRILGLFSISILTFIILYGPFLTYFPFIIEEGFGQPPYIVGIIMATASFASFMTSINLGNLTKIFKEKTLILISCGFYFAAMAAVPFVESVWLLVIPTLLFGIAQGANLPSLLSLLAGLAPMKQRAAIMSLNGMVLRSGQTLGPLVVVPVFNLWGLYGAYSVAAGIAVVMFAVAFFTLRGAGNLTKSLK